MRPEFPRDFGMRHARIVETSIKKAVFYGRESRCGMVRLGQACENEAHATFTQEYSNHELDIVLICEMCLADWEST